jgi:hypothetical protein
VLRRETDLRNAFLLAERSTPADQRWFGRITILRCGRRRNTTISAAFLRLANLSAILPRTITPHRDRRTNVITAARTSLLNAGHAFVISARSDKHGIAGVLSGVSVVMARVRRCSAGTVSTFQLLSSSLFARFCFPFTNRVCGNRATLFGAQGAPNAPAGLSTSLVISGAIFCSSRWSLCRRMPVLGSD